MGGSWSQVRFHPNPASEVERPFKHSRAQQPARTRGRGRVQACAGRPGHRAARAPATSGCPQSPHRFHDAPPRAGPRPPAPATLPCPLHPLRTRPPAPACCPPEWRLKAQWVAWAGSLPHRGRKQGSSGGTASPTRRVSLVGHVSGVGPRRHGGCHLQLACIPAWSPWSHRSPSR